MESFSEVNNAVPECSGLVVFLDRDGTIIVDKDYLHEPELVELEVNALAGLQKLSENGFRLVGITNQSGVGRGYFAIEAVYAVNQKVDQLLAAGGVYLEGWYICPHSPDENCECRKPGIGMVLRAARELNLNIAHAFVVGDKASDTGVAHAINGTGILVKTGHYKNSAEGGRDIVVPDLLDAAKVIVEIASRDFAL